MNSSPHHHHHQLVFGPLPQTTYGASSVAAPITVDTSSPPLNSYNYNAYNSGLHQQQTTNQHTNQQHTNQQQQQQQQTTSHSSSHPRRGPGSIGWSREGVSTSAERRLPFVHRFRPVGLPPPVGLVAVQPQPQQQQQHHMYANAAGQQGNMSQYNTNPVGVLQERFQSRGILPNYRVLQEEGMSHNRTFTFQVVVGDMLAIGVGNSKKQAKHAAARAMLDKMDGRVPAQDEVPAMAPVPPNPGIIQQGSPTANQNPDSSGAASTSSGGGGGTGNPIGLLQEHCVHNGLPMPTYDLGSTSGQPHQRNFQMTVKVGSVVCGGEGTSKKDAKRDAATNMIAKLKEFGTQAATLVTIPSSSNGAGEDNQDHLPVDEELAKAVKEMKIETLTPKHSKTIQQFYRNLQDGRHTKLYTLHYTSLRAKGSSGSNEYVRILAELGQEQQFEVTYVDIEEHSEEGQIQCLVQLSTLPVAVCYGTGADQTEANNDAARHALNYLKLMTKKNQQNQQQQQNQTEQSKQNGSGK